MEIQQITVTGLVATTPRYLIAEDGNHILSFRYASSVGLDEHGTTNWYTVTMFGDLAQNGLESIKKGERLVVMGELRIRDWDNGERAGTTVELFAKAVGHDLTYGISDHKRINRAE